MRPALALTPEADFPPPAAGDPAPDQKSLLRFITCGSVDDGKSTLLGRLLWETNSVFEDQAEALSRDSERFGTTGKDVDYALLVDGLAAEREQGITIDVAYRYFSTPRRAFIAADTPGHEQYTRNMATGASTADCAIILIDARKGLLAQTRRHSYIVSMLGVRDVVIAVNKMDLVDYSEQIFRQIEADYRALVPSLGFTTVHIVPLSAREGDNLSRSSSRMPWYAGQPLLALLETITPSPGQDSRFRLPVQWVNRPNADFRGYAGSIASGEIRIGDEVQVLPRGQRTRIARILNPSGETEIAGAGDAATLILADEIDVSRGDVIVAAGSGQQATRRITTRLLALSDAGVEPGRPYLMKLGTATTGARVAMLDHRIDIHDFSPRPASAIPLNGIGLAHLHLETPAFATRYADCRTLGSLLLIDPVSNEAVALGVIDMVMPEHAAAGVGSRAKPPGFPARTMPRDALLRRASWRIFAGLLVGFLVGVMTGSLALGLAAGIGDTLLRPALQAIHDALWRRISPWRQSALVQPGVDGGGI
jgi:sulfate adenylyltransferase large subunit